MSSFLLVLACVCVWLSKSPSFRLCVCVRRVSMRTVDMTWLWQPPKSKRGFGKAAKLAGACKLCLSIRNKDNKRRESERGKQMQEKERKEWENIVGHKIFWMTLSTLSQSWWRSVPLGVLASSCTGPAVCSMILLNYSRVIILPKTEVQKVSDEHNHITVEQTFEEKRKINTLITVHQMTIWKGSSHMMDLQRIKNVQLIVTFFGYSQLVTNW